MIRPLCLVCVLLLCACGQKQAAAPPPPPPPAKVDPAEIITEPVWTRRPTAAEVEALRPAAAKGYKLSAVANLWCRANADGTLRDCQIDWQDPPDKGFGEAALKGAPLYQIAPADKIGLVEGRPLEVRFSWKAQ